MPILPADESGSGVGLTPDQTQDLADSLKPWKKGSLGGSYIINELSSFGGSIYRNFTGINTDMEPSLDSINWVKIQIVALTQAAFDALVLAGTDQSDIYYDITDAVPLRIPTVFSVADTAARDAITTQQSGDTARVLDSLSMFVWDGTEWLDYTHAHIGGNFVDKTDQTISVVGTSQPITFSLVKSNEGLTFTPGGSVFTVLTAGHYNFMLSPQVGQGSGSATVEFFIRVNAITANRDSGIQLTVNANSEELPMLSWEEDFAIGDTFEFRWGSNSANTILDNLLSILSDGDDVPSCMLRITFAGHG